jgi:hypothetical protein
MGLGLPPPSWLPQPRDRPARKGYRHDKSVEELSLNTLRGLLRELYVPTKMRRYGVHPTLEGARHITELPNNNVQGQPLVECHAIANIFGVNLYRSFESTAALQLIFRCGRRGLLGSRSLRCGSFRARVPVRFAVTPLRRPLAPPLERSSPPLGEPCETHSRAARRLSLSSDSPQ